MKRALLVLVVFVAGCNLPDMLSMLELTKNEPAQPAQVSKGSEFGARAVLQELVRKQAHPDRRNDTLNYHPAAQLGDKQAETQARWKLGTARRPSKMVFRAAETKASGD